MGDLRVIEITGNDDWPDHIDPTGSYIDGNDGSYMTQETDIAKAYRTAHSNNDQITGKLTIEPASLHPTHTNDYVRVSQTTAVDQSIFNNQTPPKTSEVVRDRLKAAGHRFWAGDNIAEFLSKDEKKKLIDEATKAFETVLDALVIDRHNDPNSMDTGRRMAKMYINELMEGRYTPEPDVTAFPNTDSGTRFAGMLVATAEIKSMCSHHHQPVTGKCWIGLLPSTKVIGLSKYARLAQWYGRRGTLQEELTKQIADAIMLHTETKDVAVVIQATHGCCTNRGIMAQDSTTYTSVLEGQFYNPSVKSEFLAYVRGNSFQCL